MSFFSSVKRYGHYGYVIEDPDLSKNRIFIENQAFDLDTLAPLNDQTFLFQNAAIQTANIPGANMADNPVVITQGKYGGSWGNTRNYWLGGIGRLDPWLSVLDYNAVTSRAWKIPTRGSTQDTGREYTIVFYPRDISTNDLRSDFWIGEDMNKGGSNVTFTNSLFLTPVVVKDEGHMFCISIDNDAQGVHYVTSGKSTMTTTSLRNTSSVAVFYIGEGINGDSGSYFVEVNTTSHNYDIYKYGARGNVSPSLMTATGSLTNVIYQFPSNLKDSTTDRVVFYSSHFNASSVLSPKRIVWNKRTGEFNSVDCVMTYPGSNTYGTYASAPAYLLANYTTTGSNNYWMKPHVFYKSGTWYITFCTLEKCIKSFPTERWTTALSRTWMTYTIGSGENDYQLTYHSSYSWASTDAFPRSWVPTNQQGDVMFIVQTGTVCTFKFDTTTGWAITNTVYDDARAYGIDSTGRVYYITRSAENATSATLSGTTAEGYGTKGHNGIHIYDLNAPIANVVITMDQSNHTYSGSNVSANCYVSAFDNYTELTTVTTGVRVANEATLTTSASHNLTTGDIVDIFVSNSQFVQEDTPITVLSSTTFKYVNYGPEQTSIAVTGSIRKRGGRLGKNITLSITGNSMVFASNSANTINITTSTSGDLTVPLTIIGSGQSSITSYLT